MTEQNDMTVTSMVQGEQLKQILEAALLAAGQPLSHAQLAALFSDEERPPGGEISRALEQLANDCANRGVELKKVASGYRLQVKQDLNESAVTVCRSSRILMNGFRGCGKSGRSVTHAHCWKPWP
jgi:chromosome segregation and condensation protein ScpB